MAPLTSGVKDLWLYWVREDFYWSALLTQIVPYPKCWPTGSPRFSTCGNRSWKMPQTKNDRPTWQLCSYGRSMCLLRVLISTHRTLATQVSFFEPLRFSKPPWACYVCLACSSYLWTTHAFDQWHNACFFQMQANSFQVTGISMPWACNMCLECSSYLWTTLSSYEWRMACFSGVDSLVQRHRVLLLVCINVLSVWCQ